MDKKKILLSALCVLLLVNIGYDWLRQMPQEQAKEMLALVVFLLTYLIIPCGMIGSHIFGIVRRTRARSRMRRPGEFSVE